MEDSIAWVKTWEQLYHESPEAVEASRKHWYTVPGASKSAFHESKMPQGVSGDYRLSFMMCQMAMSEWYAHLPLADLAEKAEAFMKDRTDAAERKRKIEAKLQGHESLSEAYAKGMDSVYTLAGLTPAQTKVAQYMMAGTPDEVIHDLMGYQKARSSEGKLSQVRVRKHEVTRKLQSLLKEEGA